MRIETGVGNLFAARRSHRESDLVFRRRRTYESATHTDLWTTMIYTRVLNLGGPGARSPAIDGRRWLGV